MAACPKHVSTPIGFFPGRCQGRKKRLEAVLYRAPEPLIPSVWAHRL